MTKDQMIDVIVTELMLEKATKGKDNAIEAILRKGWKGFENVTDVELKKITDGYDQNKAERLLLIAEMLGEDNELLNQSSK